MPSARPENTNSASLLAVVLAVSALVVFASACSASSDSAVPSSVKVANEEADESGQSGTETPREGYSGVGELTITSTAGPGYAGSADMLCSYFPNAPEPLLLANFFATEINESTGGAVAQLNTTITFDPATEQVGTNGAALVTVADGFTTAFEGLTYEATGTRDQVQVVVSGMVDGEFEVTASGTCAPLITEE